MKDKNLQEKFDGYFKGITPPDDITADAKKYVSAKKPFLPGFLKFAAAAAGVALICVVIALGFNNANLPSAGGDSSSSANVYYDDSLSGSDCSVYPLSKVNSSLKFLEDLNDKNYASVRNCVSYTADGELTLFTSNVSFLQDLRRYDSEIFVEFDKEKTYSPLLNYTRGEKRAYNGCDFFITCGAAQNGEPEYKLFLNYRGIKYYFNITSSDEKAYLKFLQLIIK